MKLKTLATLLSTLQLFNLSTFQPAHAKTFDWPIDSPAARAASFTAYHGETVRFKLRFGGAMTNLAPVAIYYQTNGMGRTEWFTVPGTVFAPSNDCGAAAYRFFVRCLDPDGVDYSANGTLRMLDSPGFEPSTVQLPVRTIDFAHVAPLNAPWTTPADVAFVVTNTVGGGWSVEVWDAAPQYSDFFDGGIVSVGFDNEWGEPTITTPSGTVNFFAPYNVWPDDDVYAGDAYERGPGGDWGAWVAYIELRRNPMRNALGLARLEDIPDDIVTAANVRGEVARQLNGIDQVRSSRRLRDDGPCEYGSGWGTLLYDFTSDQRSWEIVAPEITATATYSSPLSNFMGQNAAVPRSLVRTSGTNGVDRCASATWRFGAVELADGSYALDITAVASSSAGMTNVEVSACDRLHYATFVNTEGFPPGTYRFFNFVLSDVTTNQVGTVVVSGRYDGERTDGNNHTLNIYHNNPWSVSIEGGAGRYTTVTCEYSRAISTLNQHRFRDPALGCTWQICVTNGSFFAEAVAE